MKQAAHVRGSQAGFSLIELMIVVAIIGILTTIAVPNFNRFQAKARQSEAKSQLASIYAAEKSFYAEWNSYWGDFRDIGYEPVGRLNYHVGFAGSGPQPNNPFNPSTQGGAAAGTCFSTAVANPGQCNFKFQETPQLPATLQTATAGCGQDAASTATPAINTFLATAYGQISENGFDQWSINDANILCNNIPGI